MGTRAIIVLFLVFVSLPFSSFYRGDSSSGLSAASRADRREAARLVKLAHKQDDVLAVRTLSRALLLNPDSSPAYYRLGYLHHKMNRRVAARRYYTQAIKLRRCHAKALNNLAGLNLDQGKAATAEKLYRKAVQCRARIHAPYYNLALILQEKGDAAGAARFYRRTLRIKPDHHRSHHNLGLIYTAQKRTLNKGVGHLKRAAELNPRNALNHFSLGKGLHALEKTAEAREALQRALGLAGRGSVLRRDVLRYLQAMDAK